MHLFAILRVETFGVSKYKRHKCKSFYKSALMFVDFVIIESNIFSFSIWYFSVLGNGELNFGVHKYERCCLFWVHGMYLS